jgi:heme-degrading monooxygenase HmoA
MFLVIFDVNPKPERWNDHMRYVRLLTPALKTIDGFVDNERFASTRRAGWFVSMSTWRDEKALIRWRTLGAHHEVQAKGRAQVFCDYHLRVGEIVADTHLPDGCVLRERRFDETESAPPRSPPSRSDSSSMRLPHRSRTCSRRPLGGAPRRRVRSRSSGICLNTSTSPAGFSC